VTHWKRRIDDFNRRRKEDRIQQRAKGKGPRGNKPTLRRKLKSDTAETFAILKSTISDLPD
jgi:hypothetical protein